jgi:hypothetical protein
MGTTTVTPQLYTELDGKLPIVLLPVRIETRYFAAGTDLELRVRIFPSGAHVTSDRPSPDQVEHDQTVAYWTVRESKGESDPATNAAWQRLSSMFGMARAEWLRRTLAPTKAADGTLSFPNVPVTPASNDGSVLVSQATALPTRFIVSGFAGSTRLFALAGQKVPPSVTVGLHSDPSQTQWQSDFKAAEMIGLGVRIPITHANAANLARIYVYGVREGTDAASSRGAIEDLLGRHIRTDGATLMQPGLATNNTSDAPIASPPLAPEKTPVALSDGFRVAQALGVDAGIFAAIGGADAVTDSVVTAMHLALWPATIEYFMKQMMSPVFDQNAAVRIEALFHSYVRPSGPFPALRLGAQPYGILPVSSKVNWRSAAGKVDGFMQGLNALSQNWLRAAAHAPRVGASDDTGSDVIQVLSQSPVSRRWMGRLTESHLIAGRNFDGADPTKYQTAVTNIQKQKQTKELGPLGISGKPLALDFVFRGVPFDIRAALVAPDDQDRKAPLAANYIAAIAAASVDALKSETILGASPRTLLYLFLRHATLLLMANTASTLLAKSPLVDSVFTENTSDTVWTRIKTPVASMGNQSLDQLISSGSTNVALLNLKLHRQALTTLAAQTVGELERLAAGAIDAASYRLDAWVTAMASDRLHTMRASTSLGAHLGAYGWVDAPLPPSTAPTDGIAPFPDPTSEGFVHGARLEHARTGALLRAAYLSRANAGAEAPYAIDLSSDRVRMARQLIAEVGSGANLAELLSTRIERLMIQKGLGTELPALRAQFPLDSGDGRQRIDGVALAQAWQKTPPAANLLPVANVLGTTLDAVGDLLLAEAIHQQSSGRPNRARTAISALETGVALPANFDVVETQPDATNVSWRLISPVSEGGLDAWISGLVGDPVQLAATVVRDGSPPQTASLASLGISAKGLLAFVENGPDATALATKFAVAAGGGSVTISPALENSLVVAYAISLLLRNRRPLASSDLGDVARTVVTSIDAPSKRRAWLHDVARVREPVRALAMLDAAVGARGSALTLKFASAGPNLMLVAIGDWPDSSTTGTLFDGWNEITPGLETPTGVALHYNAPRSRPLQSILLLVPPNQAAGWDVFGVETILSETADLARMRMVRPADVEGSFLPALYFADNLKSDTVATNFIKSGFIVEVKQ